MIVTCPECSTRFTLPAELLGPDGTRVKCSGCTHVWTQLPDPEDVDVADIVPDEEGVTTDKDPEKEPPPEIDDIPESVKPLPEDDSVKVGNDDNAKSDNSKLLFSYGAAAGVFVLVLLGLLAINGPLQKMFPSTHSFYGLFGVEPALPGESLIFDNIMVVAHQVDNNIVIEGEILNLGSQDRNIPAMEISLRDGHANVVEKWFIDPPQKELNAGNTVKFKTVRDGHWNDVREVNVRFALHKKKSTTPDVEAHELDSTKEPKPQEHTEPTHH